MTSTALESVDKLVGLFGVREPVDAAPSVRLLDGTVHRAELHWYEAHGIGRREMKITFPLLD